MWQISDKLDENIGETIRIRNILSEGFYVYGVLQKWEK